MPVKRTPASKFWRPSLRNAVALCVWGLLGACAAPPSGQPALRLDRPLVLLGEVHDNREQHALRLAALQTLVDSGARPALALEQFDRERQDTIDRLLAQQPRPDADALIAAAGGPGWDWSLYRPFLALALDRGLPIVAANVSRDAARAVIREGLAAQGFDPAVPDDILQSQAGDIEASHCGLIDGAMARRMALAQVARDQAMARVLAAQDRAGRSVVLLAGNGHVRSDIGVPRWLPPALRARSVAIGLLEDSGGAGAYDRVVITKAQPRTDPCEAMRARPAPK